MPKISAPTVAEHRVAQRNALIAAAEAVIARDGVAAAAPRTVCELAGLARSSFYEYFASKDDLLAAVALTAFEQWGSELDAAMSGAEHGRARLRVYVEATMRMTADGKHTLATALQNADISPTSMEQIMAMHDALTAPLRDLLSELRLADPATTGALIQGMISAGMRLVGHGSDPQQVSDSIISVLEKGAVG